jgi:hypothetical protein
MYVRFIRTVEEALGAVAGILELPERREQIVRSTEKIMLCVEPDPRRCLADAQALLVEGGLEALRRRRAEEIEASEPMPLVVLDPEEDRLFGDVAAALDAQRLSRIVTDVFPDLVAPSDRWLVARALLEREAEFKDCLVEAIGTRGREANRAGARLRAQAAVEAARPVWAPRAEELRAACRYPLGMEAPEAETLFWVVAASDDRAMPLLAALDEEPGEALAQIQRLRELLESVRANLALAG